MCGDNYADPQPREHEAGGKYATGVISRTYTQGEVISVATTITANHMGYITFKLCPHNDVHTPVTQVSRGYKFG